jgi:M3 family oligoendopeptidase
MKANLKTRFEDYPLAVPSIKILEKKIAKLIEELKECGSAKTAIPVIKKFNKLVEEISTNVSVIYVRSSINTRDPIYKRAQAKCDEISPILNNYYTTFNSILAKAKYRKDLEKEYGKYLFKMIDNSLKIFDEKIIPELIEENKLTTQYDEIMGSAQIEFRGSVYNLSQIGKFTQDKDRDTRREAAIALDKWIGENEAKLGDIYSKLVAIRHTIATKLGFKNFVDVAYLRLGRTDYKAKDAKNYRKQIAENVIPVCQKLYKDQIKNIGVKNPQ